MALSDTAANASLTSRRPVAPAQHPVEIDIAVTQLTLCETSIEPFGDISFAWQFWHESSDELLQTSLTTLNRQTHAIFQTVIQNTKGSLFALLRPVILPVTVDIKPGSHPNSINLGSGGNVPVAIFSTLELDATTIDPLTVTLANASVKLKGKGTPMASFEDVNGDGLLDLVVHVSTEALTLTDADEQATLKGKVFGGAPIVVGTDTIRVVP